MTKPLSNQIKVQNLQKRIDAIKGIGTLVSVEFDKDYNEIVLTGDGMLALKGIMHPNGKHVKITKCMEYVRRTQGIKCPQPNKPDRWPTICDMFISKPMTFKKFSSICIKYKKAWTYFPNKT